MCKFMSVVSNPVDGKIYFFDEKIRKELKGNNPNNYQYDSHTSVADYFGFRGKDEDRLNKYEYCPFMKRFTVDQINGDDDSAKAEKFCREYNFDKIIETGIFSLYLEGCTLPEGIKLPDSVGGYLDLSGCDLEGFEIPKGMRVIK